MKPILFVVLLLTATSAWAESYLCISDQAAGFSFNKGQKKWSATTFQANNKYIIKRPPTGTNIEWFVTKFGSNDFATAFCARDFEDSGVLFCAGLRDFKFNKKNMRFLSTYSIGYFSDSPDSEWSKEGGDTPSMEIGTCSLI